MIDGRPWSGQRTDQRQVRLLQVPGPVLDALAEGDLALARSRSAVTLTPFVASGQCRRVWQMRSEQVARESDDAIWVTRLVVDAESDVLVGRAGFHGRPDERGMVEVGYEIDPAFRRRGYARAALTVLLDLAAADPRVGVVRATVRPDNAASRGLIEQYGFVEVGEQWDDEDGLETIFEVTAD